MNCFSRGLEVKRRWRSVPRSSVTKYLDNRGVKLAGVEPVESVGMWTYMSSSGEIKMSLRLMTWKVSIRPPNHPSGPSHTHILMSKVLEEFKFAVCTLGQYRSAEGLHDLLHCHRLAGELIFCRAVCAILADMNAARCREVIVTKRDQRRPFQRVASRCTFQESA